ncbi:RagB/SusD family nutrient uptake outer membrane protein [Flavobacterium aciduliphilum]|uniref:SusD-like starch-binding protein associating with outer membrane n=1 Tax=Flavobacterium aciduliphilum TaxID=1101402 RepID=A0A328YPK2_9FLAO|nr:RagB/SusD family nutrient uptake outer membrane protein [Flavobacterium aciduliphilum]RAR74092.1 SusD-like starch-binding protein associating with outer membrane [Flavobacterium aciduliphilum]
MKKNNYKFKVLVLLTALFMLNSCSLDIAPKDDDEFTSEQFFSNPASYKQYLAKIYAGLAVTGQNAPAGDSDLGSGPGTVDEGFSQYLRGYWQLQELPTDEAIIAWGDPTLKDLNLNTWNADNVFTEAFFARIFYQICLCNEFLRETTDAKLDSRGVTPELRAEIVHYRAEVRFLRALSYYHGMDIFGSLPFGTEADYLGTPPPMKPRTFIFDYIINELDAINTDLVDAKMNEYGRADKAAAWMLKSKVLMNSKVYTGVDRSQEALDAVNLVINSGYTIANIPYPNLFKADNNSNGAQNEIIFPICFDGLKTQTWGGTTYLIHGSCDNATAASLGISNGWQGFRTRKEFTESVGTDSRVTYVPGNTDPASISNYSVFTQGKKLIKFSNKRADGTSGQSTDFPDTDFPMFRMGDAYLMYAELAFVNGKGSNSTGLSYINTLRSRSGVTPATMSEITADPATFFLKERAKELYWEGHRRQDLIRLGKYKDAYNWEWKGGYQAGISVDDHVLIYPIPNKELHSNSLLVQNPGY